MRKHLFFLLFIITILPVKSQGNLAYTDDRFLHLGFHIGINTMDFGVKLSEQEIDGKFYTAEVSRLQPGISVGAIGDMRLSRYFNFRFVPTFHFGARTITYRIEGETQKVHEDISSIMMTLPFYIKYSAERIGNYRPYLIAGGGIYFDFDRDAEKNILLKPFDFIIEFGVGCDIYFPFFKLCPEIKFGLGLNNMLTPVNERNDLNFEHQYTNALSRLTTRMLTLTFNIE